MQKTGATFLPHRYITNFEQTHEHFKTNGRSKKCPEEQEEFHIMRSMLSSCQLPFLANIFYKEFFFKLYFKFGTYPDLLYATFDVFFLYL